MNLFVTATASEIENVKEAELERTLRAAREYIQDEFEYHQTCYISRILALCNTPNLFAPVL